MKSPTTTKYPAPTKPLATTISPAKLELEQAATALAWIAGAKTNAEIETLICHGLAVIAQREEKRRLAKEREVTLAEAMPLVAAILIRFGADAEMQQMRAQTHGGNANNSMLTAAEGLFAPSNPSFPDLKFPARDLIRFVKRGLATTLADPLVSAADKTTAAGTARTLIVAVGKAARMIISAKRAKSVSPAPVVAPTVGVPEPVTVIPAISTAPTDADGVNQTALGNLGVAEPLGSNDSSVTSNGMSDHLHDEAVSNDPKGGVSATGTSTVADHANPAADTVGSAETAAKLPITPRVAGGENSFALPDSSGTEGVAELTPHEQATTSHDLGGEESLQPRPIAGGSPVALHEERPAPPLADDGGRAALNGAVVQKPVRTIIAERDAADPVKEVGAVGAPAVKREGSSALGTQPALPIVHGDCLLDQAPGGEGRPAFPRMPIEPKTARVLETESEGETSVSDLGSKPPPGDTIRHDDTSTTTEPAGSIVPDAEASAQPIDSDTPPTAAPLLPLEPLPSTPTIVVVANPVITNAIIGAVPTGGGVTIPAVQQPVTSGGNGNASPVSPVGGVKPVPPTPKKEALLRGPKWINDQELKLLVGKIRSKTKRIMDKPENEGTGSRKVKLPKALLTGCSEYQNELDALVPSLGRLLLKHVIALHGYHHDDADVTELIVWITECRIKPPACIRGLFHDKLDWRD